MTSAAIVEPLPANWQEVMDWFAALDGTDLSNALLGLATIAVCGVLLIVGLIAFLRVVR